jgi:UDP-N-acetylmuramate dehydrogenase
MRGYLTEKQKKQELGKPSAGCVFKNPEGDSAGRLIDASGLKGRNVGDAVISSKHANFIINKGNARCQDVLELIDIVKDKVKKDHKIELESEIKVLG